MRNPWKIGRVRVVARSWGDRIEYAPVPLTPSQIDAMIRAAMADEIPPPETIPDARAQLLSCLIQYRNACDTHLGNPFPESRKSGACLCRMCRRKDRRNGQGFSIIIADIRDDPN